MVQAFILVIFPQFKSEPDRQAAPELMHASTHVHLNLFTDSDWE